ARHQGYPALQLAILYGHLESAKELIRAGANPNALCPHGDTALTSAVLAQELTDHDSRDITKLLLEAGANPTQDDEGTTAEGYAMMRNKPLTAAVLRGKGH